MEHSSDSETDSHEYEFKLESDGNPSWRIRPDFTHVLRFPRGLESEDESNDYEWGVILEEDELIIEKHVCVIHQYAPTLDVSLEQNIKLN